MLSATSSPRLPPRQAVNAIETGKHDPSLPLAFRIARLFDMQIEEIFHDEH
jgi:putative transcriptional regulator